MGILNDKAVDKTALRKERKKTLIFTILFILFAKVPFALMASTDFDAVSILELLQIGFFLVLAILFSIIAFKSLNRITKSIYKNPKRFLLAYTILILGGFVLGLFPIVVLLLIWFNTRKLIIKNNN